MKLSPMKLKDLTHAVYEKGKTELSKKRGEEAAKPKVLQMAKRAHAHLTAIEPEVRKALFTYDSKFTLERILTEMVNARTKNIRQKDMRTIRSEIIVCAMKHDNEKAFYQEYKYLSPFYDDLPY